MKTILETPRLVLREMTQADYPALAAILQDEQTMYAYEGAFDDEMTQSWLDRQLENYQTDGFGLWAVIIRTNGEMIGQAGITWQDIEGECVPEIGYLFNRVYWHNGYATEAAIACKEYAFNKLGLKEVFSIIRSTNIASKNVAIRNGMIIRKCVYKTYEHYRGLYFPHFVLSATNPPKLSRMDDFFKAQAPSYDEYMLNNVEGAKGGYIELAKQVPDSTRTLLDLGCGTGLELEEIFRRCPDINVTGIDLTQAMLNELSKKYNNKQITLICESFLGYDFGCEKYDCIISFEAMHHFTHEEKFALYAGIFKALKPGGKYIEGDYMVETQSEEDFLFKEKERLHTMQKIQDRELYHFDTPCAVDNQLEMFLQSGFSIANKIWRKKNTTIIVGIKS